jgi:coenzyme PQQ biosynthesis protein PqqD
MEAAEQGNSWAAHSRPRLASKVRLQWNEARNQSLLLFPEGALVLNPTARAVLELCDGRQTLTEIVRELAARFDGSAGAGSPAQPARGASEPGAPAAEQVALSTDPGTSSVESEGLASPGPVSASSMQTPAEGPARSGAAGDATGERQSSPPATPAPAEERERAVERDVIAFLDRLDRKGWLVDEAESDALGGNLTKRGPG